MATLTSILFTFCLLRFLLANDGQWGDGGHHVTNTLSINIIWTLKDNKNIPIGMLFNKKYVNKIENFYH